MLSVVKCRVFVLCFLFNFVFYLFEKCKTLKKQLDIMVCFHSLPSSPELTTVVDLIFIIPIDVFMLLLHMLTLSNAYFCIFKHLIENNHIFTVFKVACLLRLHTNIPPVIRELRIHQHIRNGKFPKQKMHGLLPSC